MDNFKESSSPLLRRRLIFALCAIALVCMAILAGLVWIFGPRPYVTDVLLVAKNVSNPRLQVVCTQKYGSLGEPYIVSLWFRRLGEPWYWLYVEHEDTYWWSGNIHVDSDGQGFKLYRGGALIATADLTKDKYTLNGIPWGSVFSRYTKEDICMDRIVPEMEQKVGQ